MSKQHTFTKDEAAYIRDALGLSARNLRLLIAGGGKHNSLRESYEQELQTITRLIARLEWESTPYES